MDYNGSLVDQFISL